MIDISLPDLPERVIELGPDEDAHVRSDHTVGDDTPAPPARIGFGGPLAVPITRSYVAGDADLATFLDAEDGRYAYHLVHAALTLHTGDDEPEFDTATVHMRLSGSAAIPPVAWSLRPQRLAGTREVTAGWTLGPKLELADTAGLELGSVTHSEKQTLEDVYLDTEGELGPEPTWLLYRTDDRPLRGSYRLVMVVRAARATDAALTVTIRATVRARQLLWHRRRDLDPFVLAGLLL